MILLIRIFIFPECQLMVELLVVEFLDIHKEPPSPAIRAPQVKSKEEDVFFTQALSQFCLKNH